MSRYDKDSVAVWRGGTAFDVTGGSGHTLVMDGDAQAGQSPMELLLGTLIGCAAADVISILTKKRQAVTEMVVRAHGKRVDEHPRVYTDITLKFIVTGRSLDADAVRRAIELSEEKYCSVSAMLSETAVIEMDFEVHEAAPDRAAAALLEGDIE